MVVIYSIHLFFPLHHFLAHLLISKYPSFFLCSRLQPPFRQGFSIKNLGLSELGYRTIGNGPNQIPDMSFFSSTANSFRVPSGYMMVFGDFLATVPLSADGRSASMESVKFSTPFPRSCDSVTGVFAVGVENGPIFCTCEAVSRAGFLLRAGIMSKSTGPVKLKFMYIAVGKY
ncbi:hypothetical protein PXH59_17995 [Xenorhabdus sp. SF857]|uniref:hypothetical protein n=1 Tax=Xenorhabdus bakwenae TaxID=3026967 RepID=UPI002557FB80|nr:hypothetical protein [Xenorhabdus sp. SF857]WFQ79430.1 hypothetical protein PXH59_17995 [Xenorhabdus sp. SF857]